jgi:uncharacterized protein
MSAENEKIVKEINAAFERNDMEGFLSYCADDLDWTMAGEARTKGKTAIREWMKDMAGCDPPKIGVDRMISTEDSVVCYGDMTMKGASGNEEGYSYCDIYTFAEGKVTELRSFVAKHKTDDSTNAAAAS